MRILVASPLGNVVAPSLSVAFPDVAVTVAVDRNSFRHNIAGRVRFDVVIADLIWNHPELEYTFDGLDVIDTLRDANRQAPVLLAAQGHSMERDHVDEAQLRPEIAGLYQKSSGLDALMAAISTAAVGHRLPLTAAPAGPRPPYELFDGRRGNTAGRLAGAIAAGQASDGATLARTAKVALNTANKVTSHYLGPIIQERGEHDPNLPMTLPSVYRWCGVHARYIVSWCRRHGHADVVQRDL